MVKCQFCQAIYVTNTIFCNECGNCLLDEENRDTDPLDIAAIGWVGGVTSHPRTVSSVQTYPRSSLLRLKIGDSQREVEIPLQKFINLGRIDPTENIFPEIDLSTDGDLAKSVSRRHASIFYQGETLLIEDQASINGTFINGTRLAPYFPEALNNGDVLQLGRLLIEITIQSL
jgi:hypothetical protein